MIKKIGSRNIVTERLVLRPFRTGDAPDMFHYWTNDPEVTKYLSWHAHMRLEDTEGFLAYCLKAYEDPTCFRWTITINSNGDHSIGIIDVVDMDEKIPSCEIGYCMSREFWGQGIMTEALKVVIDYLKNVGFLRIAARHNVANPASGKVMSKAGMNFEGILRKADTDNNGVPIDIAWYSFINEDIKE